MNDMQRVLWSVAAAGVLAMPALAQPNRGQQRADADAASIESARLEQMRWIDAFDGHRAVTRPSRDAAMGFSLPTSINEVAVTGGQRVKQGDLLIRGDDAEDLAEARFQEARASTRLPVERSQADVDLAKLEFDRAQEAFGKEGLSPAEFQRAESRYRTSLIDLKLAELNQTLAALQVDRAFARVEKYRLTAPFDGVIDVVTVDVGQTVQQGDPVIRVVNVDELWIDVPVPTQESLGLDPSGGQPAWVLMPVLGEPRVLEGKVIEVAPTADAGAGARRVRVEVANPEQLPPGLNCWVRFAEPTEAWQSLQARATSEASQQVAAGESEGVGR